MYFSICIFAFIITLIFGFKSPKYYNKYSIKINNKNNLKNTDLLPDYTIPSWVYNTVFKHNLPTKFKEKNYSFIDRKCN